MNPATTEKLRSRINVSSLQANIGRLAREGEPPITTHATPARKAPAPKVARLYTLNTCITQDAGYMLDEIQLLLRRQTGNNRLGHNAICEQAIALLAQQLGISRP